MIRHNLTIALAIAIIVFAVPAAAQNCPNGQSPSDFCTTALTIPGTVGTHEIIMNPATATAVGETVCGVAIGHSVWFSVTPTVTGMLTFSTCHPSTTFDTVIQAYSGGDSGCEFMTPVECNDDTYLTACNNTCGPYRGSRVRFEVVSGAHYRFQVGSYNVNSAGCNLCLGVVVTICDDTDSTPPTTAITSPTALDCVCGAVNVHGSAYGASGDLSKYILEYVSATGGAWTPIATGSADVNNGVLGLWNTAVLPGEGYYILRLTTEDVCGNSASAIVVVWVGFAMDTVRLDQPWSGAIFGGTVCAEGTVWDNCRPGAYALEHRPLSGAFQPFDMLIAPWVINSQMGIWNTLGSPDGNYQVQLTGIDLCGHTASDLHTITIDNTRPTAVIAAPIACASVSGIVPVIGTVADANLLEWRLSFAGGDFPAWQTLATGSANVNNSVLANWNTAGLRPCAYALRLVATDRAILNCNDAYHNEREYLTLVSIGKVCDINHDGAANGLDVQPFINCLLAGP